MKEVFLSHSSKDKTEVRRLADELERHGISVWLDEREIKVGESITAKIQEALLKAKYVAVWITQNSISSGWVEKEWQVKIFRAISTKKTVILPLLADNCEIPFFLRDCMYADFTASFDIGFNKLIDAIKKKERKNILEVEPITVLEHTKGFLNDLDGSVIPFPRCGTIDIIKTLKQIPRTGKLLRLYDFSMKIPIRSIYDHTLSVAHSADCLLPLICPKEYQLSASEIARLITYHDICEIVLGDIPQYTKLNRNKRKKGNITAQMLLSQYDNGYPEEITNYFISLFLDGSEKRSMLSMVRMKKENSNLWKIVYVLDKIDPIIAVWRYIFLYRENRQFNIDEYLDKMKHFFENPNVKEVIVNNLNNANLLSLIEYLQNRAQAKHYYVSGTFSQNSLFTFSKETVKNLVENTPLFNT
jgi:5'-deoxynucleotidase YfbR-like HD superfamily hydrolase